MKELLKLIRPAHWVKNVLVLLPLLFSGRLLDGASLSSGILAFLAFSASASAVYVINDLRDVEKDKLHPVKRTRPIASGAVSKPAAITLLVILLALAVALSLFAKSVMGAFVLLVYIVLNVTYSLGLKNCPVADVVILSAGYLLRVLYGGLICEIGVSSWLYLTVLCASFYMGLGKRRGEMDSVADDSKRPVLKRYTHAFLDKNMYMFLGLANVFYALWARDAGNGMLATVPIVMILSMKYSLDVEGASDGDPIEVVFSDKWLIAIALVYLIVVSTILYAPVLL